jgi:hypothetical protein
MRTLALLWVAALTLLCSTVTAATPVKQVVAGAGPSTVVVNMFFEQFSKQFAELGYEFIVPKRSAKHAGGIKCSNNNLFGRTGRPLKEAERALNKEELFLAKVPIVFAGDCQ